MGASTATATRPFLIDLPPNITQWLYKIATTWPSGVSRSRPFCGRVALVPMPLRVMQCWVRFAVSSHTQVGTSGQTGPQQQAGQRALRSWSTPCEERSTSLATKECHSRIGANACIFAAAGRLACVEAA